MPFPEFMQLLRDMLVAVCVPLAAYFSWRATVQVKDVHQQLNSRLDQLVKASGLAGELRGQKDERERAK